MTKDPSIKDPGPPATGFRRRSRAPLSLTISDDLLRLRVLGHVKRACACTESSETNVPATMAGHVLSKQDTKELAPRVEKLLFSLRSEGFVALDTKAGRIYRASITGTGAMFNLAALAEHIKGHPNDGKFDAANPDEIEEGEAVSTPMKTSTLHWEPLQAVYRDLYLLWLGRNGGTVRAEDGFATRRFREHFGLPDNKAVQNYASAVTRVMEQAGLIRRQRTDNPSDERDNPERWANSRRMYAITLVQPLKPSELESLEARVDELVKATARGVPLTEADLDGTNAGDDPLDDEAVEETQDEVPLDVLMAQPHLREQLAERTWRMLVRAHAAMRAEAQKPGVPTRGAYFAINGRDTLKAAGFTRAKVKEAFWYLNILGTTPKDHAAEGLQYWRITKVPPSRSAVGNVIVEQRRIYTPRTRIKDFMGPTRQEAYPAHLKAAPAVLGDHSVSPVTVRRVEPTVSIPTQPTAPAVTLNPAITERPAPSPVMLMRPSTQVRPTPPPAPTIEPEVGGPKNMEEIIAELLKLVAEIDAQRLAANARVHEQGEAAAELRTENQRLTAEVAQLRHQVQQLEQQRLAGLEGPVAKAARELLAKFHGPASN